MWLVLIGPHCAGKTTVGRILANRLGWVFDEEIGDAIVGRAPKGSAIAVDEEILLHETNRDTKRVQTDRVVETWHFGNAAWALYRQQPDGSKDMVEAARSATAHLASNTESIYCFELLCSEEQRRRRYDILPQTSQLRLPTQDTLAATRDIGSKAFAFAQQTLADKCYTVETDGLSADQVADEIHCNLFDLVVGSHNLFPSLERSRRTVYEASKLIPKFAAALPPYSSINPASFEAFPGLVIVVEGLDGSGKTTLVELLRRHIGKAATSCTSPPSRLGNSRKMLEGDSSRLSTTKAYGRFKRAFYSLGNYALSHDLQSLESPCVVDRFVTSTLSYTYGATDAKAESELQPRAVWPEDIPKPDIVLILEPSEEIRRTRIEKRSQGKGIGVAEWETETARNRFLAPSILYHMKNIQHGAKTRIVDVSADDPYENLRRMSLALVDEGIAMVFREVIGADMCEGILEEFQKAAEHNLPRGDLNRYKWDHTNTIYESGRHNASVCFLESARLTELIMSICKAIVEATNRPGWTAQDNVLPIFSYQNGGFILPHRDVNLTSLSDYCAVLMLSKRGHDFENGSFYVNGCVSSVDDHGQCIGRENQTKGQRFDDLDQGDIVVFRNSKCVHGVDTVRAATAGRGRITTSFRI